MSLLSQYLSPVASREPDMSWKPSRPRRANVRSSRSRLEAEEMQSEGKIRGSWRSVANSAVVAAAMCAAVLTPSLTAQVSRYDEKQMAPVSDKPPAILSGVGIAQNLNRSEERRVGKER